MLGRDGCRRLAEVLSDRALAAARAWAAGRDAAVRLGGDPAGAGGRVIVVSAEVPRLSGAHLDVAALDLDEGADVSLGSTLDGGAYLVAMRTPRPELLEWAVGGPADPSGMARALGAAQQAGLEAGLLRMERRLRTPADAAAMLADPLLPAGVRAVLTPTSAHAPPA